jgi:hypothetical protein
LKHQTKKVAIAGLVMALSFAALAQIPSDANLVIQVTALAGTNIPGTYVSGVVSNTESDVLYEMQYRQNKTNWNSLGFFDGSEIANCQPFRSWITNSVEFNKKAFRIRSWKDSYQLGIADWWQIKYFGKIGIDPDGDPMGDGWSNREKYGKEMDPFKWYQPPEPQGHLTFQRGADAQHEDAILTWRCKNGPIPDAFAICRARQTIRGRTNLIAFPLTRRTVDGKVITNQPPPSLNAMYHSLSFPPWNNLVVLGSYQIIAQVPEQPNMQEYRYVDTNLDFFPPPVYRVQAHYPEPTPFAKLREVTATTISNTILAVTVKQQTNGYELTVRHPFAHARYLLLVRDKNDQQWRASGYFVSGTNRHSVYLHVDKKGMMTDKQSPIALPKMKFLPDVVKPEFTAGWGEDGDGDGLPDIYEVLVTHTNPDDADTGDTGILDGFRAFTDDGWNNWQKFLYRANPFHKCEPPPAVVLNKPTTSEMIKAQTPTTDLPYEIQLEIRTNGAASFQAYSLSIDEYLPRSGYERGRCDVRVSWKVPPPRP